MGKEIFQMRNHKDEMTHIAFSRIKGKVATCGNGTIKVHDLSDLQVGAGHCPAMTTSHDHMDI